MKTLVIHPDDRSTDFLRPIYKYVENLTLLTGEATHKKVIEHINNNDRVIMLGHGSSQGLFGTNFNRNYVIESSCVEALREKEQNVIYIWCNADLFVNHNKLKGMYSGMFISEVGEAVFCGIENTTQEQVNTSNDYFAKNCGDLINESIETIFNRVKENYTEQAFVNPVARFNSARLWLR